MARKRPFACWIFTIQVVIFSFHFFVNGLGFGLLNLWLFAWWVESTTKAGQVKGQSSLRVLWFGSSVVTHIFLHFLRVKVCFSFRFPIAHMYLLFVDKIIVPYLGIIYGYSMYNPAPYSLRLCSFFLRARLVGVT